jgi:hypothetical protein
MKQKSDWKRHDSITAALIPQNSVPPQSPARDQNARHAPNQPPKRVQQTGVATLPCSRETETEPPGDGSKTAALPCNKLQHLKC